MNEINYFLAWAFLWPLLSLLNLPLTKKLLPRFFDGAWIFSRIFAYLLLAYFAWLTGMLKILPFNRIPLLTLAGTLLAVNFLVSKRSRGSWVTGKQLKLILFEELLFLAAFSFWIFVRAHNPSIHDLEKFMDFGFINSFLRSGFFPPKDIWLSGHAINYYYFGHLVSALLIRLTGVPPAVGYNLMLASLFALTLSAAFSLGYNFFKSATVKESAVRSFLAGLMTAAFLTLFGNLQVIFAFIKGFRAYWYPDATRFIPRTIHEFPIYSFVVADLHGHLLDIPFVLLFIAFLYTTFSHRNENLKLTTAVTGFLLAVLYMTNAADALIYFSLFAFLRVVKILVIGHESKRRLFSHLFGVFKTLGLTAVVTFFFSLPFQLTFKPFSAGVALAHEHSPLWMFLILWIFFLFFAVSFFAYYLKNRAANSDADRFFFWLSMFSIFLILLPEFIYFKDIYTTYPRANTMFKFTYQAFILFALVGGFTLLRLMGKSRLYPLSVKSFWLIAAFILVSVSLFYPYFAVNSAYGSLGFKNLKGLDGLKYLQTERPFDYQAINWLNRNIRGQPVILEAVGESYTDYARISANTGLPTVLGWPVHEWLWRNDPKITEVRRRDVEMIYTTEDPRSALELLKKYDVSYVYLGDLEREKYPTLNKEKLFRLGRIIYRNSRAEIIKLN